MPPWTATWSEGLIALERWVLPGACLLCQDPVGSPLADPLVCAVCRLRWRRLPEPRCVRCGQPIDLDADCRICRDWPDGFRGVQSAVWLEASARRAVHLLKYEGWRRIAVSLAEAMLSLEPLADRPTLVPIPLSATRLRARGYNQSAELAAALLGRRGGRVSSCLGRTRHTRTQTTLTPEERAANLAGAFATTGAVPSRVVLGDDVFTNGASLVEAAHALLEGGAVEVSAVTFGRAELPLAAVSRMV